MQTADETHLDQVIDALDKLVLIVKALEERISLLEDKEEGLIPYSNDPTEIEIAQLPILNPPERRLHTWTNKGETDDGVSIMECSKCGTNLNDCGNSIGSWYCGK